MSGLHLPPAEPPDEDLAALREMVERIRGYLADAERQVALLEAAVREHAETPDRVALVVLSHYAIELELARKRVTAWQTVAVGPEWTARQAGLQL